MRRLPASATAVHLAPPDWRERLETADYRDATVFHLAARTHDPSGDEQAFMRDNVEKTVALAERAAGRGARRFVYLSSIKVLGEETKDEPFRASDTPNPLDAYARSKHVAETELQRVCRGKLALVIVRSPLVAGPDAKGNLRLLLRLADSPWPLPLGGIDNRRTLVQVDDLAALLCLCGASPEAQGGVFLAGDPDAFSTPRLVRALRRSLGREPRLLNVPPALLERTAGWVGARETMRRLTRSLEVDASQTCRALGWTVSAGVDRGLAEMARAYRDARSR